MQMCKSVRVPPSGTAPVAPAASLTSAGGFGRPQRKVAWTRIPGPGVPLQATAPGHR